MKREALAIVHIWFRIVAPLAALGNAWQHDVLGLIVSMVAVATFWMIPLSRWEESFGGLASNEREDAA